MDYFDIRSCEYANRIPRIEFLTEDIDTNGDFMDSISVDFDHGMYTCRGLTWTSVIVPKGFIEDLCELLNKYGFKEETEY